MCGLKRIEKRKRGGGNGTLDMGFIAAHLAQQRAWKSCFSSLGPPDSPKYAHDYGVPDYQFVIPCLLFKYRTVSPSPDAEIPRRCVEFVISLPPFSLFFFPFPQTLAKRQLLRLLLLLLSGQSALLRFLFFIFCGESNLLQKAWKTNRPKKKKEWKFSLNSVPLLEGERNFYDAPTFSTIQPPPRI